MSYQDENTDKKAQLLHLATRKASAKPFFLASALETFCKIEQLEWSELATHLNVEPPQLDLLALCRRPDMSSPAAFQRDIRAICERFGIAPFQLAALMRRVAAYEASQANPPATGNFLMAARDYEDEDEDEPDE